MCSNNQKCPKSSSWSVYRTSNILRLILRLRVRDTQMNLEENVAWLPWKFCVLYDTCGTSHMRGEFLHLLVHLCSGTPRETALETEAKQKMLHGMIYSFSSHIKSTASSFLRVVYLGTKSYHRLPPLSTLRFDVTNNVMIYLTYQHEYSGR